MVCRLNLIFPNNPTLSEIERVLDLMKREISDNIDFKFHSGTSVNINERKSYGFEYRWSKELFEK